MFQLISTIIGSIKIKLLKYIVNKIKEQNVYRTRIEWKGWIFEIPDIEQRFGKTKVEVYKNDIEEVFYIEEQYLSELICNELYDKYLYVYEG